MSIDDIKRAEAEAESARQAETTRQATLKKQAELKRIAEQVKAKRQAQIQAELRRIEALKKDLMRRNAQKNVRILRDAKTGEQKKIETLIDNRTKERIYTVTNLATGEVKTRTFEQQRNAQGNKVGGLTVESGGLVSQKQ